MINAVQDLSEEAAHWSRVIHDTTRLKVAEGPTDGWGLSAVAIMVHKEDKPRQASLLKGLVNLGVVDICERLFTEGSCFDSSWAKVVLRILGSVNQDARLLHELFTDISGTWPRSVRLCAAALALGEDDAGNDTAAVPPLEAFWVAAPSGSFADEDKQHKEHNQF